MIEQPKSSRAIKRKNKHVENSFDPSKGKLPKKMQLDIVNSSVKYGLMAGFSLAMCRWASEAEIEQTLKHWMENEDDLEKTANALADIVIKFTHYKSVRKKAGRTESPLTTAVRLLVSQNKTL